MKGLHLVPVTFQQACDFVAKHHRHHKPPQGWKFGVGAAKDDGELVGVAMVGRPVARMADDGRTLEVTRCCTDGTKNTASLLYGAAARAAFALGYRKLLTYTLASESGISLRASGYREAATSGGGTWSRPSRPRIDKAPIEPKLRWEADPR